MIDRKKDDSWGRFLFRMSSVLLDFNFVFKPIRYTMGEQLFPPKNQIGAIAAYERFNGGCAAADKDVVYRITMWDPRIAWKKESLGDVLGDIQHAVSCGCQSCYGRIQGRWENFYQQTEEWEREYLHHQVDRDYEIFNRY